MVPDEVLLFRCAVRFSRCRGSLASAGSRPGVALTGRKQRTTLLTRART